MTHCPKNKPLHALEIKSNQRSDTDFQNTRSSVRENELQILMIKKVPVIAMECQAPEVMATTGGIEVSFTGSGAYLVASAMPSWQ